MTNKLILFLIIILLGALDVIIFSYKLGIIG